MKHLRIGLVSVTFLLLGCGRINTRIRSSVDSIRDAFWPIFDANTSDSRFNRKRFAEFLQVPLSPDVRDIYCYADRIGIDSKFQFAFSCDVATITKIIKTHKMCEDTTKWDCNDLFSTKFHWWQPSAFCHIKPWVCKTEDSRYFQYLWYDSVTHRAWYIDFDL